jgi:hypothetical protein
MSNHQNPGAEQRTPGPEIATVKWGERITVVTKVCSQARLEQSIASIRHIFTAEQSDRGRLLYQDTRVAITAAEGELLATIVEMREKPTRIGVIRQPESYGIDAVMRGVAQYFETLCKQ